MKKNRASLLLELIRENGTENIELFDLLVPERYGELYSLYCILEKTKILDDATFDTPPSVDDEILTVTFTIDKSGRKKCIEYIESLDNKCSFLKKDHFELGVTTDKDSVSISFTRIK